MADTDAKLVDRITKLLRLATNNSNVEEARSAALQAAKLIVQHRFAVGRPVTRPSPQAQSVGDHVVAEQLRDLMRQQQEREAAQRASEYWQRKWDTEREQREAVIREQQRAAVEQQRAAAAEAFAKGGRTPDGHSWWQRLWA